VSMRKVAGELPVSFRYTPGVGNTAFFHGLLDRGAFVGSRCPECELTYVPSRLFCERCFSELSADAECGPEGELVSWTIARVGIDGEPLTEPETIALVKLDGADTVLMHRLIDVPEPAIGMQVRAVVREERTGSILDVEGFTGV